MSRKCPDQWTTSTNRIKIEKSETTGQAINYYKSQVQHFSLRYVSRACMIVVCNGFSKDVSFVQCYELAIANAI